MGNKTGTSATEDRFQPGSPMSVTVTSATTNQTTTESETTVRPARVQMRLGSQFQEHRNTYNTPETVSNTQDRSDEQ